MDEFLEILTILGVLFLSIVLVVGIVGLPIQYYSTIGKIAEFKSIQQTLNTARENKTISPFELAALQTKAVEGNMWLAGIQYWNSTILEWYIPDEVDNLQPIQ